MRAKLLKELDWRNCLKKFANSSDFICLTSLTLGCLIRDNYICHMKPKIKLSSAAIALLCISLNTFAQVPTNQDCLNAIPICNNTYSTTISYSGTGNYPNEINNGISCLGSGEKNDVWYTFTTPFFGNLNFTITPNNPTDDYDWAVYNLTTNGCADIFTNPGMSIRCNYAPNLGCGGTTGPNNNTGGPCGGQNETSMPVTPGQTYVINVSNFSSTQSGYLIDFNASTAGIFDVFPPALNNSTTPACGSTSITWTFNENVTCASVQPSDFVLTGPGGPYTITSITSAACATGAAYGKSYTINFTPAIAFSGAYNLALVSPVTDLCGNNFSPLPYNKAYSVTGVNLVKNHTDVTCPGDDDGTITLNAVGVGPFTYQWSPNVSTTNTATGLPAGVYTITVTPSNASCPGQATITVIENLPVTLQSQNIVASGCSTPIGSIAITPTGGVGPYTYQWSPSGGTGATASNLASGNYTLTVTDTKGCDMTQMFVVPSVNGLNVSVASLQNVKCKNGTDGAINTSVTGATGAVTYLWSNSAVTANLTNIPAGTYSVTVTEGICTATIQNILVNEPANALTSTPLPVATTCGNNNGSASMNASGGTGAYTYIWSPSGSGSVANNLTSGNYTVTITDANLCTLTKNFSIGASTAPVPSVAYTRQTVSCFGGNNGNATVNVAGGAGPYSYQWSGGLGTGNNKNNLTAGNYTVTVTDALNCTATVSVSINAPAQLTAVSANIQNVKCFGLSTGSAGINASGGTGALTYQWSPAGGSAAVASNLAAGAYTVTVTDANACTKVVNLNITQPVSALQSLTNSTATSCGNSNGIAGVTPSGGTGPYTYLWSNAALTANIGSLTSGNYTVTITDANLCILIKNFNIAPSSAPVPAVAYSQQTVSCFGGSNGNATVNVAGGVGPYSYQWSSGLGTGNNKNNLTAGNYIVTVTDAANCTAITSVTINAPAQLTAVSANIQNVKCFGLSTGSASINASGGTGALTYQWSPAGGSTASANNLIAGIYTVTVTDANACTKVVNLNITQPATALSALGNANTTTCGNTNGTAGVVASGGTPPYAYLWSNAGTTANLNSLLPGNYTVTVTDANLCTKIQIVNVGNSSAPVISNPVVQNLNCAGVSSGSVGITVSSGVLPYTYAWTGNVSTSNSATNLASGNYNVIVTDNLGCSVTGSYLVTSPTAILFQNSVITNVNCFGQNTGSVLTGTTGGTGTINYLWSTSGTGSSITNLPAGSYTVTATDQNNCSRTQSFSVTQPNAALNALLNASNTSCGLINGSITPTVTGGTSPYTYAWSNGATSASIVNSTSGTYTITVTDAKGCINTTSAVIAPSSAPVINNPVVQNLNCAGVSSGSIGITMTGGISPYTYQWTNNVSTSNSATALAAGNYNVIVTDNANCTVTASYQVTTPAAIIVTLNNKTDVDCFGNNTGEIDVTASGGTGILNYLWSNALTTPVISSLITGSYTVSVTDQNNCKKTQSYLIAQPASALSNQINKTATSCGLSNGTARAIPAGGTAPYKYLWSSGANTALISALNSGNYSVTVSDDNGCSLSQTTYIQPSSAVTVVSTNHTDALCNGTATGSAIVSAAGGITPYTYAWNNGQTTQQLNNIMAGTYNVTITDQAGCISTASIVVVQPTAVQILMPSAQTVCSGISTTLTPQVNGGTTPYQYTWSNGNTSNAIIIAPTASGQYSVTVTDGNGCVKQSVASAVNVYPPIALASLNNKSVCEGTTVSYTALASGGNGIYQYNWGAGLVSNPVFSQIFNSTANVNVIVNDGCNYTTSRTATVNVVPLPDVEFINDVNIGCLPLAVQFKDKTTAVAGSAYAWDFGDGNTSTVASDVNNLFADAGIFQPSLTVTTPSPELCSVTYILPNEITSLQLPIADFAFLPEEPTILNPTVSFKNLTAFGNTYTWSFGDGTVTNESDPAHTYATIGIYSVLLTSSNSYCEDTVLKVLEVEDQFSLYIPKGFTPNNDGRNDEFSAYSTNVVEAEVGIYNRWGQRVYAASQFPFKWNGRMNNTGSELPSGSYVYSLKAIDKFGNKHTYNGAVNLLR